MAYNQSTRCRWKAITAIGKTHLSGVNEERRQLVKVTQQSLFEGLKYAVQIIVCQIYYD